YGDEHLDTILATKSDEFIKSCVKTLVPNPSESEGDNGYDVPACFTTFSNILFDDDYESDSSDYQSCSDEDFLEEIFSNPLFEEEIIPMRIDQHHFNADELALLKAIPPGIDKTDCHSENEIRLIERLLYDNSSARPPDSFMEEIDLTFTPDDRMPPSIEDDDDDSKWDNLFLERLLHDDPIPLSDTLNFSYDVRVFLPFFTYPIPACCDDDDDDDSAITPILSTEETENSLTLKDNPHPSSDCKTKSSSTSLNSFLEETNTFHNSLPEFENFYFDLGEISSGSTTTHSDISLPDYEAFYFDDDHIKEISSGSTTTHYVISLSEYDSFIFEEFVDELAYIISSPEYDCFYFKDLPNQGELMYVLNSGIRENLSTTLVNLPIEDDHSPLLAYVVWIFHAYLTYPVIPPYFHPFGNEDTIFDPGITINSVYSFEPVSSHRHQAFKKFNTHRSHLNEWPMTINGKNTPL
nr:hypothetical protein [Tanacetum cinerariifolium]